MWPAIGHLNPTLKIARTLQKSGHQLFYLGLSDLERKISSQGFEFLAISDEINNMDQLLKRGFFRGFFQLWPRIMAILKKIKPDLLVVDEILREIAVQAQKIGFPGVLVSTKLQEVPISFGGNNEAANSIADLPVLVLCPREFDSPDGPMKKNRYSVEASIDLERRELYPFPWEKLDDSKPIIYCSFGSNPDQYDLCQKIMVEVIEAIERMPEWQLVLASGGCLDSMIYNRVNRNIIVVDWVPQLEMLKKASIMITHGGLGTIKECIFLGVPMIVLPMKWDQPTNAVRVAYHGLGLQGDPNLITSRQINSFIDILENDESLRSRVASMSKIFKEAEDLGGAVKIIENVLALSSGPRRRV